MRGAVLLAALLGSASACEGDPAALPRLVGDSAGVRIIEYEALPEIDAPHFAWRLDTLVSIDASAVDSSGDPVLYDPRRFAVLEDGTWVVVDGGPRPIAVIRPSGEVDRLSSWGEGPGEIQSGFALLSPAGADLFDVFDPSNRRVTRFDVEGRLLSQEPLRFGAGALQWLEIPSRLGAAFAHLWFVDRSREGMSVTLGDSVRRIHPPWPSDRPSIPLGSRGDGDPSNATVDLFDARLFFAALETGGVVTGRNDLPEYRYWDPTGELSVIVRVPLVPRPIDDLQNREILEEFGRVAGPSSLDVEVGISDHYPLVTLLRALGDSTFVLEHSRRGSPAGDLQPGSDERVWRIFETSGHYLGAVRLPPGFMPQLTLEMGVIGVLTDEVGRQRVMRLELLPPAPSASR